MVEVVLDCTLVAAGDKDECVDASPDCLLGGVLNEGFVNDRQAPWASPLWRAETGSQILQRGRRPYGSFASEVLTLLEMRLGAWFLRVGTLTVVVPNHSCQFVSRCVLAESFAGETQLGKTLRGQSERPKAL